MVSGSETASIFYNSNFSVSNVNLVYAIRSLKFKILNSYQNHKEKNKQKFKEFKKFDAKPDFEIIDIVFG